MKALIKSLAVLLVGALLASCGGGGGGGSGGGLNNSGLAVTVSSASAATTPFSLVGITAQVSNSTGGTVADGTLVRLQAGPAGLALVSTQQTANGATQFGESVTAVTIGGRANFRLHTRAVGSVSVTASVQDGNRTVTGSTNVTIAAGPANDPRISLVVQSAVLPSIPSFLGANANTIFVGSPYLSEVTLVQRRMDGTVVNSGGTGGGGQGDVHCNGGSGGAAAIGGGLNNIALWLPAEGVEEEEDDQGNTIIRIFLCRSITLGLNSGRSVFYVVADGPQGQATVTVSATDPDTGEQLSISQVFTVQNGAPQLPGSVIIEAGTDPVYITPVNGAHAKRLDVNVIDGGGSFVPNPAAGVNNVRLEIIAGGPQGGERLRGVNAAGSTVTGSPISIRTANGIAAATFEAGTRSGFVTVQATSDRADNNIDNGIADPVSSTRQFSVSDGRLFDIEITTSDFSDPVSNLVDGPAANSGSDGVYRRLIGAIGTDRFGNPVPAGQEIRFGLVDEPQQNNQFLITGPDGDPQEGGTSFSAPTGTFTTSGGGAGPGDTLLVFGEDVIGNRDLESARTVTAVASPTQLLVSQRFNFNDDTGSSVNNGPVLPYVIGRAADGNIQALGTTDVEGVAVTLMSYPARKLGKRILIWAQGTGDQVNGTSELVSDVEGTVFQAAGPATLTVDPAAIVANRAATVRVCLKDGSGNGVPNAQIAFAFNLPSGSGTVDGVANAGFTTRTGADGCVNAAVTTQGVLGQSGTLVFNSSGATATVQINAGGAAVLTASPNPIIVGSGSGTAPVSLCVFDGSGPVPGVQIVPAGCTVASPGVLSATSQLFPTGANGCTTAGIQYGGLYDDNGTPANFADDIIRSGTCTFRTVSGLSVVVTVTGGRFCNDGFSPPPPGCP
jgi:hypothetical protein